MTIKQNESIRKGWKQYSKRIVEIWDDFVSWEKRSQGEGNFFINKLKENNVKTVLDVACGTGYDSMKLIQAGFKVKSCDGSNEMIKRALINAKKENINLDIVQCDWRNLVDKFKNEKFDAIVFLGNSFTHLFSEKDRKSVMNQLYFLLNKGGILIIDHRNYDYLLSRGYKSKHKYVYCGETINVDLVQKDDNIVKLKYRKRKDGFFILEMYPLKFDYMVKLMKEAGFNEIESYGDFSRNYDSNNTDFFQHISKKLQ